MSGLLLITAMVAAVNPFRSRIGLGPDPYHLPAVATGVAAALSGVALLAAGSASLLESLQITPETFLIAAGLVAIIAGARDLFAPQPFVEPTLAGWRSGLWPLAFPRLLSPEVVALSLALPSQRGVGFTIGAAAMGLMAVGILAMLRTSDRTTRLYAALGAIAGMVLVVVGVWMMIEGIRDV